MNELIEIKVALGRRQKRTHAEGTIVSRHFAVTRSVMPSNNNIESPTLFYPNRWTITHRHSGFSVASNIARRADAIALAKELEAKGIALGVDWAIKSPKALQKSGRWDLLGAWWLPRLGPLQKAPIYRAPKAANVA